MIDLLKLQRAIFQNKVDRHFNVSDVGKEIVLMVEELGELANGYKRSDKRPVPDITEKADMVDAVGDLMIYCLGLCEMLQISSEALLKNISERHTDRTQEGWI